MCSSEKADVPSLAQDLYRSARFRLDRNIAERTFPKWRILSGRYGILSPLARVAPYDFDLDAAGRLARTWWVVRVATQLVREVGWRAPAIVGIRARGFYLEGAQIALSLLGFRMMSGTPIKANGSALWIRGDAHVGTAF
jgi:hypothetical protein